MLLIDELVKDKTWKKLIHIKDDKRMKSEELILRFFALTKNLENYQKPLSNFLNNYCEKNKNMSASAVGAGHRASLLCLSRLLFFTL